MGLDTDVTPPPSVVAPSGSPNRTPFVFQAATYAAGQLRVLSFRGREVMSRPFRFDVLVAAEKADHDALKSELLGQAASLLMVAPPGAPRTVCGIIAAIEAQGA